MAFGVEELRVLRRALALALHPTPASAQDVQDCLRLAESLDEATREGARLRAFLVADLARYRAALPGTAAGYLTLLEEALSAGYRPDPDDLAALRALRGNPVAATLLQRCQILAEQDVRARLARRGGRPAVRTTPSVPASRTRLLALPGGLSEAPGSAAGRDAGRADVERTAGVGGEGFGGQAAAGRDPEGFARCVAAGLAKEPAPGPVKKPPQKPAQKPAERPQRPGPKPAEPAAPKPSRPIPTPGEVFPRRKPSPPPADSRQQLAAG
ncbi:hypothetical protein [Streptomyces resistomycificus]|uniref:Uncharacterized protein n=1 Tax=Streptomyces resistomycificus TaxID=67356 RepID=A0A0L8LAZ8_9ACTN|nr:hypothetical protein [Streptomyces resistomycificus]KOG35433.1 hypothetical protein ADK37_15385 [Streptomyces resistomycificus]KUN98322.1 hypothetical protein AQJ84_14750 [Streptomyces resistomycificus]